MHRFYCQNLLEILTVLEAYRNIAEHAPADEKAKTLEGETLDTVCGSLKDAQENCRTIGLEFSAIFIDRKLKMATEGQLTLEDLVGILDNLQGRVKDELSLSLFFHMPRHRAEYYDNKSLLGDEVTAKYPSASIDIEEAGKCFATARYTACVFHLMRAVEIGVMAFAGGLNILGKVKSAQPSWGEVLRLTNEEIQRQNKGGDPAWTPEKRGFFENVQADLMTVKNAWRNSTMHVENTYDEERAEDIFNAAKGFMRHLAKHLDESGNFTP